MSDIDTADAQALEARIRELELENARLAADTASPAPARSSGRWRAWVSGLCIVIAAILRPGAGYLGFAMSFVLIGAGFVIATTVRTAIIFASLPRGLPATAAALNEASVALGSRAALVVVTVLVTTLALDSYAASLGGRPPGEATAAVEAFRTLLSAINMPTYGVLIGGIQASDAAAYGAAYTEAVRTVMFSVGALTLLAAPIAWLAIGGRDPLETVWQHQDEREATPASLSG